MPKLITKQDGAAAAAARKNRTATWLSVGGLLALLAVVAVAAFLFTRTPLPGSELEPLTFGSATNEGATAGYESLYGILSDLMAEYEGLAGRGVDDYQKNLMLQGKSESILAHLDKMDAASDQLGLDDKEYRELGDRHQFYKDFWQAKLHFRQLRISRFENTSVEPGADDEQMLVSATQVMEAQEKSGQPGAAEPRKKKFQFAKPPEGMELPAGFCDLSDPDSSCKPDEALVGVDDGHNGMLPEQDLPLDDGNLAAESVGELPLSEEQPKKRKFQFAKPPEGMELPAGFCDLSDPNSSCKPDEEMVGTDGINPILPEQELLLDDGSLALDAGGELPLNEGDLLADTEALSLVDETLLTGTSDEQPKKRRFQFAKPPEGMELPAGFCDLSNPGSCKPESN